jgi:Flp pilus assembly protein TadD
MELLKQQFGQCMFLLLLWATANPEVHAQAAVYRCPGTPEIFTSDQRFAQTKGCASINGEREVVTRASPTRKRSSSSESETSSFPSGVVAKIATADGAPRYVSAEQKARESDRLTILLAELRDEKQKLEALKQKQIKAGGAAGPNEDSGSDLSKAVARSQSDVNALEREIARVR